MLLIKFTFKLVSFSLCAYYKGVSINTVLPWWSIKLDKRNCFEKI